MVNNKSSLLLIVYVISKSSKCLTINLASLFLPSVSTVKLDLLTYVTLLKTLDVTNALHEVLSFLKEFSITKALKPVQQSFHTKFQKLTASINKLNFNTTVCD